MQRRSRENLIDSTLNSREDLLLEVIATSINHILKADSIKKALPFALDAVASALYIDRMIIIEETRRVDAPETPPSIFFVWNSRAAPPSVDAGAIIAGHPHREELFKWLRPLHYGQAVIAVKRMSTGAILDLLSQLKVVSVLVVPVLVNGVYWGSIGFDDCRVEHEWTEAEIRALTMFAEFIGTAITRERYIDELAKANTIVQNSPTVLYRLRGEPSFPMVYVSRNVSVLGYSADEMLSLPTLYQSYIHPDDRAMVAGAMLELLNKGARPVVIEFRMIDRSGDVHWMENRFTPVRDTHTRLVEVEGIQIDITERKLAESKISLMARTDALTGIANRATFNERLAQCFIASKREPAPFAVFYLDLDRFKEVNDTRGHPAGDKLLQEVSARLLAMTRESDVVARLGGDEFAIIQTAVSNPADSSALATKIIAGLSAPYAIEGHEVRIGTSVGIAILSYDISDPAELMSRADRALYRAKEEGRGQYRFHSDDVDNEAREQMDLATELKQALADNQLELYYQPQIEYSSRRTVSIEAIACWNHPFRGRIEKGKLLAIAEKAGLSTVLGKWILDGACRQLAHWRVENFQTAPIALSMTLAQMKTGKQYVRDVKEALDLNGLKPNDLEIDVTELLFARSTLAKYEVLDELHRFGVCIAIDDFGEQYSSLDYLRTYNIRRLKISDPTVNAANDGGDGMAMVRAIMSLATELGIEVVANSDETIADLPTAQCA